MSLNKKIFFLFLSLSLILCQSTNKTEESKKPIETKEVKEEPKKDVYVNTDELNTTTHESIKEANYTQSKRQRQRRDFRSKIPLNMTENEMDTILLCTAVVQETIKKQKSNFKALQKRLNLSNLNPIYDKVGGDIFEKRNKNLDIKIVHKFIKNLTYFHNFKWVKEFDDIAKIDYDKYNNQTDLVLNYEQQLLMYKFQRIDELYRQKKADERDNIDKENEKIKIGEIDMENIPSSVKFTILLVIIIIFFGGVFYLLKIVEKKPKDKKKKEKKKKTQ